MSISFMALAWKAQMPSGRKLVLLALCDHANGQGECYPSVEAIARKCGMGQRTVQQHIGELERAGILVRRFRTGRSTWYRLEPHNFCHPAESAAPQDSALQCAASGTPPPQDLRVTPADAAPISISEPSVKASNNHQVVQVVQGAQSVQRVQSVRGTPLPPAWTLPAPWAEWAMQTQPAWTAAHVQFVAAKFRDHWTALPGQRGIKADWLAAWRNWCRNEKPVRQGRNAGDAVDAGGKSWTSHGATNGTTTVGQPAPVPGESLAAFNARVMRHREDTGARAPLPGAVIPSDDSPATDPPSSANRAAALAAARALKSRLQKQE